MEKIKVGGVYLNGDGNLVIIYYEDLNDPVFKFDGYFPVNKSTCSYTKNGCYFPKASSIEFDLIEEVYYSDALRDKLLQVNFNIDELQVIFENEVKLCH